MFSEAEFEQLLKTTIVATLAMNAGKPKHSERVIEGTTVREKAIAQLTDSRLLSVAGDKLTRVAKRYAARSTA